MPESALQRVAYGNKGSSCLLVCCWMTRCFGLFWKRTHGGVVLPMVHWISAQGNGGDDRQHWLGCLPRTWNFPRHGSFVQGRCQCEIPTLVVRSSKQPRCDIGRKMHRAPAQIRPMTARKRTGSTSKDEWADCPCSHVPPQSFRP